MTRSVIKATSTVSPAQVEWEDLDVVYAPASVSTSKQDALVSGTNIKTINGGSVLGSGDLVVAGAAAWGSVTGTLGDQTDLQTALDAKLSSVAAAWPIGSVFISVVRDQERIAAALTANQTDIDPT